MPTILHFLDKTYFINQDQSITCFAESELGLSHDDYWISGSQSILRINLRLRGGKGGFGRAMRQEGERRSRRLPPNKDSCRTLSGRRIGFLKAKRRVVELKAKIKEMEAKREEMKAIRRRTNAEKEMEEIEKREQAINETIRNAVDYSEKRKLQISEEGNIPKNPHIDVNEFSMLFEENE